MMFSDTDADCRGVGGIPKAESARETGIDSKDMSETPVSRKTPGRTDGSNEEADKVWSHDGTQSKKRTTHSAHVAASQTIDCRIFQKRSQNKSN